MCGIYEFAITWISDVVLCGSLLPSIGTLRTAVNMAYNFEGTIGIALI